MLGIPRKEASASSRIFSCELADLPCSWTPPGLNPYAPELKVMEVTLKGKEAVFRSDAELDLDHDCARLLRHRENLANVSLKPLASDVRATI